jgi:DNA-binding transcriptional regulator YdaS (Cro superfamily)
MTKHPVATAAGLVGGFKALADILGVTKGAVHQWMSSDRQVPIEHCTPIEQATKGKVTRQMLRPNDWQSIWPELIEPANGISDRIKSSDDTQNPPGGTSGDEKLSRMVA